MNEMRVRALERNYGVCFQYRQLCRRKWGESWSRKSEEDVVYLQKPKSPDIGDAIKFTQFCSLFDIMEIGYDNLSIPYWRSLKNTLLNTYRYYMELGHFKLNRFSTSIRGSNKPGSIFVHTYKNKPYLAFKTSQWSKILT